MKLLHEKKSLNKTAESLYMTQSAVSKRLQRIEAEWDIKVVKRTSKGVIFTPSGDALAHLSLTVLEGMDALRKRFRLQRCHKKGRGQQLLRFGITNSFARLNLSDLVSAYSKACDELSVHPILGSWDSNIKKLNEGSVDVAVCFDCHENANPRIDKRTFRTPNLENRLIYGLLKHLASRVYFLFFGEKIICTFFAPHLSKTKMHNI